jgi:ABC-type amino acid transport substrate-binding protein
MVTPSNKGKGLNRVKKLGTIGGYTAPAYNDLIANGQVKLIEVFSFSGLLKMVMLNRLDAAYVSVNPSIYQLREVIGNEGALTFDDALPFDKAEHLLSTMKNPEVVQQFNQFITDNQQLINDLKHKHRIQAILQ